MTPEILTATAGLGQYGAIGVVILSFVAVLAVVLATFKFNASQSKLNRTAIAEQSHLNREAHKDNTQVMSSALSEVTSVVAKFASENKEDHTKVIIGQEKLNHGQNVIVGELKEIKAEVK